MIEIPSNESNRENVVENAVKEVLAQLDHEYYRGESIDGEDAYLDWTSCGLWKNCDNKDVATEVGRLFKAKGYFVYYQTMGYGNKHIPEGTPISVRICKKPSGNASFVAL